MIRPGGGVPAPRHRPCMNAALRRRRTMATNIYVGNLAWGVTDADLEQMFSQYGTVRKAQVVMDRDTGRSRGFGFVEMENGAQEAIQALNGHQHEGRPLTVNEAKPREQRGGGGGGGGGG